MLEVKAVRGEGANSWPSSSVFQWQNDEVCSLISNNCSPPCGQVQNRKSCSRTECLRACLVSDITSKSCLRREGQNQCIRNARLPGCNKFHRRKCHTELLCWLFGEDFSMSGLLTPAACKVLFAKVTTASTLSLNRYRLMLYSHVHARYCTSSSGFSSSKFIIPTKIQFWRYFDLIL